MDTGTNLATAITNAVTNVATTVATNTAAAATAATRTPAPAGPDTSYLPLFIWTAVVLGLFFFLWQRGYITRIRGYVAETQEELKKCTWPSVDELKGSTVVVMITIVLLGAFTISVDWVLSMVMRLIT